MQPLRGDRPGGQPFSSDITRPQAPEVIRPGPNAVPKLSGKRAFTHDLVALPAVVRGTRKEGKERIAHRRDVRDGADSSGRNKPDLNAPPRSATPTHPFRPPPPLFCVALHRVPESSRISTIDCHQRRRSLPLRVRIDQPPRSMVDRSAPPPPRNLRPELSTGASPTALCFLVCWIGQESAPMVLT
ncbi:hypothetical protein B296_00002606 [Ensete ventricosum]|uniref:Uncharacterized protein n=1 Tax=Ensete ventricosum TaxID=4639 RepID=A0A427BBE8_ENSVE|nr:hypothetical protein B296_00002606 [Ensete ventricosum]